MKYLLLAFPLFFYFEILGRYIFYKLKKETLDFSFVVGYLFTIAFLYVVGWPISAFNQPSIYYVILVCLFFLTTIILIIKDIENINFKIDYKLWILFDILLVFEIYMSWNRTLGQPHGFDALYYINYIGFNVDTNSLNSLHPHFGTTPNTYKDTITYVFQSYNYFISSFVYICQKAFSLINRQLDFLPTYVWTFQILLHMFFISTSLMCIKELKIENKVLKGGLFVLLTLFLNNVYYNNAYGFIGNTYRMSIHAIATLFLFRYFKSKDHIDLFLFFGSMLGMCGFSSTGTFATIFVLFGLFFYLYDKEKNLIKYYTVILLIPTINILCVKLGMKWYVILGTIILFAVICFLNDLILNIYKNKYVRYGTIAALSIFIIAMAIIISVNKDYNIFKYFINNYSEIQDMSWDYFDFKDMKHWIFNLLVLIPLFYHLIKNKIHPFSIICIILIATVFNPLGGNFMNKINWVYYRTYDIIINQYTLGYFIVYLINSLKNKYLYSIILAICSLLLAVIQIPSYWHESFIPDDDYNNIYKIENSEFELITNVKQMVNNLNIDSPAIITSDFYIPTFIKDSTYLIGKEKRYDYANYSDSTYQLYLIFFPVDNDYDNFRPVDEPRYDEVIELLKQSEYDILIVKSNYFITYKGEYMSLADAVTSDGTYKLSEYSTSEYSVIHLS